MQIEDQEVESLGAITNATLSLLLIFPFFKGTSLYIYLVLVFMNTNQILISGSKTSYSEKSQYEENQ